jgi:hypothetical protein
LSQKLPFSPRGVKCYFHISGIILYVPEIARLFTILIVMARFRRATYGWNVETGNLKLDSGWLARLKRAMTIAIMMGTALILCPFVDCLRNYSFHRAVSSDNFLFLKKI